MALRRPRQRTALARLQERTVLTRPFGHQERGCPQERTILARRERRMVLTLPQG
jgi:hypothetical protein